MGNLKSNAHLLRAQQRLPTSVEMMRAKWLKRTGIIVFCLMGLNVWLQVVTALIEGDTTIGRNYWNAPIFTLLTLAILLVITPIGLRHAARQWNR